MMWPFTPREQQRVDEIVDIRPALGSLVRRVMQERDVVDGRTVWSVTVRECTIRGVPVGDWEVSVRRPATTHQGDKR